MKKDEKIQSYNEMLEEKRRINSKAFASLFGERLREFRLKKGLLQKQIAKKIGVTVSRYANWEQGRREPSVYDIFMIISTLEIEPNQLFNFDELTKFIFSDAEDFME